MRELVSFNIVMMRLECFTHPTEPYAVLSPINPKPMAGISGPFLPSLRVGSLAGGAIGWCYHRRCCRRVREI